MILALSSALAGCAGSSGQGSGPVKVGWIGSLTGPQALWGQCELATVKMYFEEVNAAGGINGRTFEVIGYDSKGEPQEAVQAARRLATQDKVVAIIGPNASSQAIPVSEVLNETKVPGIATVATNPRVTIDDNGAVKPYMFRVCFIDPYQGSVAAGFSFDQLGARKAAILYDVGDDYSQGIIQYFIEEFERKGGAIVSSEAFNTGDVEFRPQLTKIKDASPDVIFMPLSYKEVALSTEQARELGITATFIGTDTWPSDELLTMAGESVEGAFYVNHLDFDDPVVQEFKAKYREKEGLETELNGFLAWDASTMVIEAIKKANSFEPDAIRTAMEKTSFQGLTGNITINPETHNPDNKEAAMIKIVKGQDKYEYKFEMRYSAQ